MQRGACRTHQSVQSPQLAHHLRAAYQTFSCNRSWVVLWSILSDQPARLELRITPSAVELIRRH